MRLFSALYALAACDPVEDVAFTLELDDSARAQVARLEVWIATDSCEGATRAYDVGFAYPTETAPSPQRLPPGHYFLGGRGLDASCDVVVAGCVELDLPIGRSEIVLPLAAISPAPACPVSQCTGGSCADCARGYDVAAGAAHTCALASVPRGDSEESGHVYCWGDGTSGQLGTDAAGSDRPLAVALSTPIVDLGAGGNRTCAIGAEGDLYCWGGGTSVPTRMGDDIGFASVSVGLSHACAVKRTGELFCFGAGSLGQLGLGAVVDSPTPMRVGAELYRSVSAADTHTCAVRLDGRLACWGDNSRGQLGDGTPGETCAPTATPVSAPQVIGSATDWTAVATGSTFTCGARSTGVFCWGSDERGERGDDDEIGNDRACPTSVDALEFDADGGLALGHAHACAIDGGRLFCWGTYTLGQIGAGTPSSGRDYLRLPTQIGDRTTWRVVAAGADHTCAIDQTSSVYCTGANRDGRTGQPPSPAVLAFTATCLPTE